MRCGSLAWYRSFGLAVALAAAVLAACSTLEQAPPGRPPALAHCDTLVESLDDTVRRRGVRDRQDRPLSAYPYLRVNRFLASYRRDVAGAAFEYWLDELQALGLAGWRVEYRNLPVSDQQALWQQARAADLGATSFDQALASCMAMLRNADLDAAASREAVREAAVVADNYSLLKRTLGLYPLTSLGFSRGVLDWHREVGERYALALDALPVQGELRYYRPPDTRRLDTAEVAAILQRAADNALGIPKPPAAALEQLFASFAPVYAIDTVSRDDRPGAPRWLDDERVGVDVSRPVVYHYVSHTRYRGRALLQLNYLHWFPARTAARRPDLLAGQLDGLVWRVTLRASGEPLAFDTIHPCGCYHLVFPGPRVAAKPQRDRAVEPVLFPPQQSLPAATEPPLVLRIASATHYVERVYAATAEPGHDVRDYALRPAAELRSLAWRGDQRRSLFGENGLVSGSERLERFLFWPMGIASAGAMRQPGHQATAFVGRRHFDDAELFDPLLQ